MKLFGSGGIALFLVAAPVAFAGIGSISLIDGSGLEFFINTDVTFATSSNASGAVSDATYTGAVTATTSVGGTVSAVLSDAFNGYNALFVNGTSYNLNGPASVRCGGREVVFAKQTIGNLEVKREVFVPLDDSFCRWLNHITNKGQAAELVTLLVVNRLGSGSDTVVVQSSAPPAVVTTADSWAVTMQDFSGGVSPDPRLGHVFRGPNGAIGLSSITMQGGSDLAFWEYQLNIQPGATAIVVNFVTGQPSIAEAVAKCEDLIFLPDTALACINDTERTRIVNFDAVEPTVVISSTTTTPTNVSPIPVTVKFSEIVTGFTSSGIVTLNGTIENFDGSGADYDFDLVPTGDGLVRVDIPANVAQDLGGNPNKAATTFTRTFDGAGPTVAMSTTTPSPSNISTVIQVDVVFSEPVSDFSASDITTLNASVQSLITVDAENGIYRFGLLPNRIVGEVGADIKEGVAHDDAGNPNIASAPFRHTVGPGFSCIGGVSTKGEATPVRAGVADLLPLAAVTLVLAAAARRARKN
jgi:hypothetical protein